MKTPLLCKLGIHLVGTSSNSCMYNITKCDRCRRATLLVWLDRDDPNPKLSCLWRVVFAAATLWLTFCVIKWSTTS